jgi:hypothetical protein
MLTEPIRVTLQVTKVLDELKVAYAIGGSLASAVHGVLRATLDADIVADLRHAHAQPLVRALGNTFYADLDAIEEAIHRRATFNLLHLETMFKVDIFVAKLRAFDRAQLARRQLQQVSDEPERYIYVASPEDIILAKLEWYRLGGQVSDRQWQDILGVIRVQGDRLDQDYLRQMAIGLDVTDLLQRALAER